MVQDLNDIPVKLASLVVQKLYYVTHLYEHQDYIINSILD